MWEPYKRLQNLATWWSNILAIFVRITGFKLGKLPYFKALFSAVSMDFCFTVLYQKLKKKKNR